MPDPSKDADTASGAPEASGTAASAHGASPRPTAQVADPEDQRPLPLLAVIGSVLAAAIGVQSRRNRERDFTRGNIFVFIAAGVIFTVLFVVAVWTVVQFAIG